jgi:hypothetical protein
MKPPLGPVRIAYGADGEPFIWREHVPLVRWKSARPEDAVTASAESAEPEMPRGWPPGWPVPEKFVPFSAPVRDRELDYPAFGGQATGRGLHGPPKSTLTKSSGGRSREWLSKRSAAMS